MLRVGAALAALLTAPAAATAAELVSAREFLTICASNQDVCHGFALATTDWYRSEMTPDDPVWLPYCLPERADDAKAFVGLVLWYFNEYRALHAEPWSGMRWADILDRPVQDMISLLPAAYPCDGVIYPPIYAEIMGYDD